MKLDSARELKRKMKAKAASAVRTTFAAARRRENWLMRATARRPAAAAAFGLAPVGRGFHLAIRIFRGTSATPRVLAAIAADVQRYEAEIDLATGIAYEPYHTLEGGVSIGHSAMQGAGTLGGFVEDDEAYYLLSNSHVIARCGAAQAGDPIYQPGLLDAFPPSPKTIAYFSHGAPLSQGVCDAAVAELGGETQYFYPWDYDGVGRVTPRAINDRYAVRDVEKLGRTTGYTRGRVSAFDLDGVTINYGNEWQPVIHSFDNQLEFVGDPVARPFSQRGDSGSFIFDRGSKRPYALLFAGGTGEDGIERTIGTFMPDVLTALDVRPITT
jgi:hypothetical protein